MGDFDWLGTCKAIVDTGDCDVVIAGDSQGNIFSSYPLADDGNYKWWVFSDPYKATVSKEDGSEVEEDIYEAYNLSLLVTGQKDSIPQGHGVRINGDKFMHIRVLKGETYNPHIGDAPQPVTLEEVHVLKKGKIEAAIAVKGGYFFIGKTNPEKPEQTGVKLIQALAVGMYWAVGPDAS